MYGMNENMIEKAKYKIKSNKAFMKSHGIVLDSKIIPFSDFVSNSYINSDRYIAELQHRAWSIYDYAKNKSLSNIFLTLTLPSNWHSHKTFKDKLINNPKFGGRPYLADIVHPLTGAKLKLLNSKENIENFTPRNASKELSKMLRKIHNEPSYRNIEKDDRCYFRVTEPHKNGTPHLHVSIFLPEQNIDDLVKSINRLFPSPQSKIELNVDSPVSYLMKYILKTLDDLREDKNNVTALSLWYIYHGISRFYTSRTFVSLEIYRKLKGMYTLNELTSSYHNEDLSIQINTQTGEISRIENEHGVLYSPKPIMSRFSDRQWRSDIDIENKTYYEYEFEPIKFKPTEPHIVDVVIDDEEYILFNGSLKKTKIQPHEMNDIQIYDYFQKIDKDIENVNLHHYGQTKNIMIERGLIDDFVIPLNSYSVEF